MREICLVTDVVSKSGNIALYPALTVNGHGVMAAAWYEYSSSIEASRSDVWFSTQGLGSGWSNPIAVSGGISYNNGPTLVWMSSTETWQCAWHSWRPPGKEPFEVDGDITHVWINTISAQSIGNSARQALPGVHSTEYASLVASPSDQLYLLYFDRTLQSQNIIELENSSGPEVIEVLPRNVACGRHGDMAIAPDGKMWMVFVGNDDGIYLVSKSTGKQWNTPNRIDLDYTYKLTRPKISIDFNGMVWVACHSNHWGSGKSKFVVENRNEYIEVKLDKDDTPGNHCWTCNAISIKGEGCTKTFSFGPDIFSLPDTYIAVDIENSLYCDARGYGFYSKPKSQLRKLGDNITRGIFYNSTPTEFRINVSPGKYQIEVVCSSWISPRIGTSVKFNCEVLESQLPKQEQDKVVLFKVNTNRVVDHFRVTAGNEYDENRPSRLIHDHRTGRHHLLWTSYGPERVKIVHGSFL